jgi:hypothetical protein
VTIGLTGEALEQTYCAQRHRVTHDPRFLSIESRLPRFRPAPFSGEQDTNSSLLLYPVGFESEILVVNNSFSKFDTVPF